MKITIVGGGNIGTQFAVHCAEKGHDVIVYSSKPGLFHNSLSIVDENHEVIHKGTIICATDSEEEAFSDAELIFVTVPAMYMKENADKIFPYVRKGLIIGLIPGTGGGECAFRGCMEKGAIIFGLQRVPSVARLVEYGKTVCAVGYRKELYLAALPHENTVDICNFISDIFDMPCVPLPNYLNLTLTPSNPILHTARLKIVYEDYHRGVIYERIPLFYEEWNDRSSKLLFLCDAEVQDICCSLSEFDLSYVKSLRLHYESRTYSELTQKISGISSLKGLETPALKLGENQYVPDFDSRYFTSDFSYGLTIFVQIGDICGVDVENMRAVLAWYQELTETKQEFRYSDYNISSREDLVAFYSI